MDTQENSKTLTPVTQTKGWDEITTEEKIERMRTIVKDQSKHSSESEEY